MKSHTQAHKISVFYLKKKSKDSLINTVLLKIMKRKKERATFPDHIKHNKTLHPQREQMYKSMKMKRFLTNLKKPYSQSSPHKDSTLL